jgi:hypothetical protein
VSDEYVHNTEIVLHDEAQTIEVAVHLNCTASSEAPSGMYGPPEFYDPGGAAEFELSHAVVSVGSDEATLTSELFWALLGDKAQIMYDNAVEAAQGSGEF